MGDTGVVMKNDNFRHLGGFATSTYDESATVRYPTGWAKMAQLLKSSPRFTCDPCQLHPATFTLSEAKHIHLQVRNLQFQASLGHLIVPSRDGLETSQGLGINCCRGILPILCQLFSHPQRSWARCPSCDFLSGTAYFMVL